MPIWSTPPRQALLVRFYLEALHSGRVYAPDLFSEKLYDPYSEMVIDLWKALDREEREASWQQEKKRLHALLEIHKRGPFDTIAREEYLANRPLFSIKAVGVGAFTFKRMAKVRIPALGQEIWVSLAGVGLSRNKKRKLLRYGKGAIPREQEEGTYQVVKEAVSRELAR